MGGTLDRTSISQLVKSFETYERFDRKNEKAPGLLYHYTSAFGLHGICTSKTLHATDAQFTNDPSELTYASETIDAIICELRE
jgi:hypothetical protein